MKTRIICMSAVLVAAFACQKQEIKTYPENTDTRYIYFARTEKDSTDFSFSLYPGQKTVDYEIVVKATGYSDRDQHYKVEVLDEYTTAQKSDYSLPDEFIFSAGAVQDTFAVKLNYSEKLDNGKCRLALKLVPTDDFELGMSNQRTAIIWLGNDLAQPEWWTSTVSSRYMGPYSVKKYKLYLDVVGVDLTGMSNTMIRYYCLILKNYIAEQAAAGNVITEENGTPMVIYAGGY